MCVLWFYTDSLSCHISTYEWRRKGNWTQNLLHDGQEFPLKRPRLGLIWNVWGSFFTIIKIILFIYLCKAKLSTEPIATWQSSVCISCNTGSMKIHLVLQFNRRQVPVSLFLEGNQSHFFWPQTIYVPKHKKSWQFKNKVSSLINKLCI